MIPNNPPQIPDYLERIKAYEGLTLEDLGRDNLQFFQLEDSFKFGNEQVLLAHFANELLNISTRKKVETGSIDFKIIDPGSGSGILTILISALIKNSRGLAIEIMERPYELLKANLSINNLDSRFHAVRADITEKIKSFYPKEWAMGTYNMAICNPPYFKINSGPKRSHLTAGASEVASAREELHLNLEDYMHFVSDSLQYGGIMAMVNRPERLVETIEYAKKYNLYPYYMRQVVTKPKTKPKVFLLACIKGKARDFKWGENLVIYEDNGVYTPEVAKFYNS